MSSLEFRLVHQYQDAPALRTILYHEGTTAETVALLDTGAAYSAFDSGIAEALGIDLAGPPQVDIVGFEVRRIRVPRRTLHVALYAGGTHLRTTAAPVLFVPNIGLVSNVIGRDLLADLPFALIHGAGELHLGLTDRS